METGQTAAEEKEKKSESGTKRSIEECVKLFKHNKYMETENKSIYTS